MDTIFPPPQPLSLPVRGLTARFPVNRLFFVGRNYHAHAIEMGRPVDKSVDPAFYFTKSCSALAHSGSVLPYPPRTQNFHYEMEMVVAIGASGFQVPASDAHTLIYGYAAGLDMTRRDLQFAARDKGRPWDTAKDVEGGAVCSEIVPMPQVVLDDADILLDVNGVRKQVSNIRHLIWSVREIIEDLSTYYTLAPGDLIFTGTPEGVGPVVPGDELVGHVAGVASVQITIGPPIAPAHPARV